MFLVIVLSLIIECVWAKHLAGCLLKLQGAAADQRCWTTMVQKKSCVALLVSATSAHNPFSLCQFLFYLCLEHQRDHKRTVTGKLRDLSFNLMKHLYWFLQCMDIFFFFPSGITAFKENWLRSHALKMACNSDFIKCIRILVDTRYVHKFNMFHPLYLIRELLIFHPPTHSGTQLFTRYKNELHTLNIFRLL